MTEQRHSSSAQLDHTPANKLRGRRIVITGAAAGIAHCTARVFASEGATLTLIDRDADRLRQTAEETGGHAFQADITDEASIAQAIERGAQAMGGIDGVVNAAGIMLRGSVQEVTVETWRRVLDVNLTGAYIVVRSCLPWLSRESAASIVNIASAQGLLPNAPNHTAYAASKAGVVNLSRALAAELAPQIRVNCICPGLVDTAMADGVRNLTTNYALGRPAGPVEIARAILFLTSSDSSYVTGSCLAVDGGRSFH